MNIPNIKVVATQKQFKQIQKPKQEVLIKDKNIKVNHRGYICIYKTINGIPVRVSTKLKNTEENYKLVLAEAHNYIKAFFRKKGYEIADEHRGADEYLHESLEYLINENKNNIKESSLIKYKNVVSLIKKEFKHKRTNAIDKKIIKNLAVKLHNKGLSKSHIGFQVNIIIRAVNNYREYFNLRPINRISIKGLGAPKTVTEVLSEEEITRILKTPMPKQIQNYLMIACHTGARVGEILALTKKDIDIQNNTIHITKSKNLQGIITEPKTKTSARQIPIINKNFKHFLIDLLNDTKDNELFNIKRQQLRNEWIKLLKQENIEYRRVYNLRHSFATLTLRKSKNILGVSHMLGHANPNITLTVYAKNQACLTEQISFDFSTKPKDGMK